MLLYLRERLVARGSVIYFVISFLTGCDVPSERVPTALSDSRFNGEFWYHGTDAFFVCYEFNGTNKVIKSQNSYHYIYDISISNIEFQISNGKYRYRVWSDDANYEGSWIQDWAGYSFSTDGNTLTLDLGSGLTNNYKKQ